MLNKIFSKDWITWTLVILLLLSVWPILAIEIGIIPRIQVSFPSLIADGLNRVFLSLAYSYIAGIIVYALTVLLPEWREKNRLAPVIESRLQQIGLVMEKLLWGFLPNGKAVQCVDLYDVEACLSMLKEANWNAYNPIPFYSLYPSRSFKSTFYHDYRGIQKMVHELLDLYQKQLSVEQIRLLEQIEQQEFMITLEVLQGSLFPPKGQDPIVTGFREVLEAYAKLVPKQ